MPDVILNPTLYADRTVQDWHRDTFRRTDWAIDLDLMGACNRCRQPLYLIEATTNPNKPFTILYRLAERSRLPAFIVFHDTVNVTGGKMIYPSPIDLPAEKWIHNGLALVRQAHEMDVHGVQYDMRTVIM